MRLSAVSLVIGVSGSLTRRRRSRFAFNEYGRPFFIIFFMLANGYVYMGKESFSDPLVLLDSLLNVCAIIGFFLYAYGKRWGPLAFWRVFTVLFPGVGVVRLSWLASKIRGWYPGTLIACHVFGAGLLYFSGS